MSSLSDLRGMSYIKGHGNGNDFILIDDVDNKYDLSSAQVKMVCDRNFGLGADGFIRAVPAKKIIAETDIENDIRAYWFMDYRNQDGSIAQMCGNGVRVFTEFLLSKNLINPTSGVPIAIATRAGTKYVEQTSLGYRVNMGVGKIVGEVNDRRVDVGEESYSATFVNIGNPHTIAFVSDLFELNNLSLLSYPNISPPISEGSNVEFATVPKITGTTASIDMRVYERGVGETLACGTGACATALAAREVFGLGDCDIWEILLPGGMMIVRFSGVSGESSLEGGVELISEGVVL